MRRLCACIVGLQRVLIRPQAVWLIRYSRLSVISSGAALSYSSIRSDVPDDIIAAVGARIDALKPSSVPALSSDESESKVILSQCEWEYLRHFAIRPTILRYLAAHKSDVDSAVSAMVSTVRWRITHSVDLLYAESLRDKIVDVNMYVSCGRDRGGRPIIINHKSALAETDYDRAVMQIVYTMERAIATMKDDDDDDGSSSRWTWLLHMQSFSNSSATPLSHSIQVVRILTIHYPERLHAAIIIDAPTTLLYVWSVVKWLIPRSTADKIEFVTTSSPSERERAHKVITKTIDADQLESVLGGTQDFDFEEYIRTDPLPSRVRPYMTAAIAEYHSDSGLK